MLRNLAVAGLAAVTLAACDRGVTDPILAQRADAAFSRGGNPARRNASVYALTNDAAGNAVLAFARNNSGSLDDPESFPTGGTGSGAGLGSQGAVVLSDDGNWLIAVNAGSNDVSAFRVTNDGLELTDVAPSGGVMPISVTIHGSLIYVLNAGGVNNISGLRLSGSGGLSPVAGSTQPLSAAAPGPAQVEFSPGGDYLVVTEKGTNLILTYAVDGAGVASAPQTHVSSGATPFGFAFGKHNTLIVSEAFGGAADASAASSYRFSDGDLMVVTGTALTTETAACWTVVTRNGRFAYVTNTGSGTVTGYSVNNRGVLSILDSDGVTGVTGVGSAPADAAIDKSGRFLYTRNGGNQTISIFRIGPHGSLTPVDVVTGLPASAVGLAAR